MQLEIPRDAQFVDEDGVLLADGDDVEITVTLDPSLFFVQFGPHGSSFTGNKPAKLTFNYSNSAAGFVETDLVVMYQPEAGTTWAEESTQITMRKTKLEIDLYHFSNYAVAW